MLKHRIITASILALIVVWIVLKLPTVAFGGVLALVVVAGAWEWARLAGFDENHPRALYASVVLALILMSWPLLDNATIVNAFLAVVVACWGLTLFWMRRYHHKPAPIEQRLVGLAGLMVLVAPWVALMVLHAKFGPRYVLFLLLLVWAADIGAYFAGRRWGQHKLAPVISPGKTWEGVGGALAAVLVFSLAGVAVLNVERGWLWFMVVCLVTMGFSVIGDLFESMMKRQRGVKDSGSLLPGHGGILDRVDSLTAAAPVFLLGLYGVAG